MKVISLSILCLLMISSCENKKEASGSSFQDFEVILSDELKELDVQVISQSIRESGVRSVRFFIILDKEVSELVNSALIFKVLTRNDRELVGGILEYQNVDVGGSKSEKIPDNNLTNRAFIYSQSINPMDVNLVKKIKIETYSR